MRIILFIACSLIWNLAVSQSKEEDQVRYDAAIEWLDSKLNYTYYDEVGEKWWTNTFYVNEQKEVTIKHVASKKPNTANIKNKTYTIRSFKLDQINPYNLKITDIEKSSGRIVKGKMLELKTFDFRNQIHKRINNKKATSTSFLYLSFPIILNDSISNYAEIVKEKFKEAIIASTRIYPKEETIDKDFVFKVLSGKYQTEEKTVWNAKEIILNVLKIETAPNKIMYVGYEPDKQKFYLNRIDSQGIKTEYLEVSNDESVVLLSNGNLIFKIHSFNSFEFIGEEYFRQ